MKRWSHGGSPLDPTSPRRACIPSMRWPLWGRREDGKEWGLSDGSAQRQSPRRADYLGVEPRDAVGEMKASFPDFAPCKVTLTPGRNQNVPLFVQHVSRLFVTPLFCLFRKYGEGRFSTRAILSFIDAFVSELFKPGVWFQKTESAVGWSHSK